MTTISNQNSLNDPLARTKGGCANNDSTKNDPPPRKEVVEEGYDGVMPLLGIKQEFDEEIASVEADGMGEGGYHHSGGFSQGGNVEKKILTVALVNSMTEAPRSAIAQPSSEVNTNQRSVGTRSVERQAAKTEASISYPSGGASHVTPTTSEASSFSSVESADHESSAASSAQVCNPIPQLQNGAAQFHKAPNPLPSNSNSRTIYPRASKAAASTKVATAFNHTGGNSPRGKRKIDAVKTPAMQPTGKLIYRPQSQPINNSASASVPNPLADIATPCAKMPPPQPQVTFQYMQYPLSKSDPAASNSNGNNSFSGIAESMSSQKYQTDDLMSSSANELMSSQQQSQQGRGRIFSIDLDPSVLDFVESVVDPLGNSDDAPQGRSRNYSVTFDDDVNSNSGRLSFRRDRGFSFEFFSFGFDGDEPLPPIDENSSAVNTETNRGNRIRGDSIIFDPISFHDGGIHVTSALMHVDHVSQDNIQEYPASQPVAAAEAPQAHYKVRPSIIHHPPQVMRPPMPPHYNMQKAPQNPPSKPSRAKAKTDKPKRSKAKSSQNVHVPSTSSCRQITITTSSSSRNCPQSFSDNTIHMPHGSDAAAAAAAGMTPPSSTSSEGFGGISHTSCPMELLNKGGRIGIYLPEERKARIAKFHDKRKQRMWRKKIKYDCRKKLADSRPRIKGRFVKRSDVDGE